MAEATSILRRLLSEAWGENRPEVTEALLAADALVHVPGDPDLRGAAGLNGFFTEFRRSFPDLAIEVREAFGEDGRAVAEFAARGTQRGRFMGVPATKRPIDLPAIAIARVDGDRIVELWGEWDRRRLLEQLGVMPAVV